MTKRLFLIAGAAMGLSAQAQTMDQVQATRAELLADASGRQSSLAQAAQEFTVNVHGYEQFRYNWNGRDDDGIDANNNDQTVGFQNARTRLNFSGNIGNENWGYFIQFGFGDIQGDEGLLARGTPSFSSGGFLEDAYGWYKMGNGWSLKFGQFKLPLFHEQSVGDTYTLFADRSVVDSLFTQGRSQGVQVGYEGDTFHFYGAFSDGVQTANTDYDSVAESDFALTARGEFKWAGDWKQYKDFTSFRNSEYFGVVGGALHYQSGGDTVNTADVDDWAFTVDAQMEGNGWNVYGAFIYNALDPNTGNNLADWAIVIQGGIFVSADWEIVAGADMILPDSDWGSPGDSNFTEFRLGVNHYVIPESHAIKFTIDLAYFIDNPSETALLQVPNTAVGLFPSNEDGQFNILGQVQLVF
jgi:hypothetical protein